MYKGGKGSKESVIEAIEEGISSPSIRPRAESRPANAAPRWRRRGRRALLLMPTWVWLVLWVGGSWTLLTGMGWDLFLSAAQDDARPLSAGSESLGLGRGGRHLRLNEYASCRGSSPHALAHGTTNLPAFSCKELKTRYGRIASEKKSSKSIQCNAHPPLLGHLFL